MSSSRRAEGEKPGAVELILSCLTHGIATMLQGDAGTRRT